MGIFTADLTADAITTVWNALEAHARTSHAYSGRAQGDDRSISQRRADGLVDLCAGYLDGVSAGDLDYQAPRTSTGWTTYRPSQPDAPSAPSDGAPPAPSKTVAPRILTDAASKRLRSVLTRRCMINVHMGADVVPGQSDNPVYLDGYGWTPTPIGRRILSHNADMRTIAEDTRIELADLVASEHDNEALTLAAARRSAINAVLYAANPAPF